MIICVSLVILSMNSIAQKGSIDCGRLKNGTFYLYPKNSGEQYMSMREGNKEFERNLVTGDSTTYQLNWITDCNYTVKLVKTSEKLTPDQRAWFAEHQVHFEVTNIAEDYYVFKARQDKKSGTVLRIDTMWLKPKTDYVSNKVVEYIKDPRILKKQHFGDTSKYAVLYVYRTPKTWAFLANVNVYLDDVPLCIVPNNSAFAFKIFKQGTMKITSNVETGKMAEQILNVEFGKKYFLKTSLGLKSGFSYKIPILALNPKEAEQDFETLPYGQ